MSIPKESGDLSSLPPKKTRTIQSVDRALNIIEVLSSSRDALLLNRIAEEVEINASTCHHLLTTLVERGYAIRISKARGYMLSSKLRELSERADHDVDVIDFVQEDLRQLNEELRETVQLAVLRGSSLITRLKFSSMIPTHVEPDEIKKMRAAHATATGKAILAWLPEAEMARVVSETGLDRFTGETITSLPALIEALRLVRRSGYSVDNEELEQNVICIGAALRDGAGAVIGSISASIPKSRATSDYRAHVAEAVMRCARSINSRIRAAGFH